MTRQLWARTVAGLGQLFAGPEPFRPWRVWTVFGVFLVAFAAMGLRIGLLAGEPAVAAVERVAGTPETRPVRSDMLDRNGELLATTIPGWSLHARPLAIADHRSTARKLARVLDLDAKTLETSLRSGRQFVWIRQQLFAHEKQAVQELGLPGLVFARRPIRVYPLGSLASHVVGGVRTHRVDHWGAEIVGVAGVEAYFDHRLRAGGEGMVLSIDRRIQALLREVLQKGIDANKAKGGSAVVMDIATGELHGLVSLPDFDPNRRPLPLVDGFADEDPLLNRAAQGVYELGSTLKPITAALAIDRGGATLETSYPVGNALRVGSRMVREHYIRDQEISLLEVVQRSSNVGSALAALAVGGTVQQSFLRELGLLDPLPIEVSEANGSQPIYPALWKDATTATVAYGHGLAITPVHLAGAIATLVGDGRRVRPTLLRGGNRDTERAAVVSPTTVQAVRTTLRSVVQTSRGTGRRAAVAGYDVGGKTGTADKPIRNGRGYSNDRVISTFVSAFPMREPRFILVASLDEPEGVGDSRGRRQAGRTAAPVAGEMIARIGALLGIVPDSGEEATPKLAVQTAMY